MDYEKFTTVGKDNFEFDRGTNIMPLPPSLILGVGPNKDPNYTRYKKTSLILGLGPNKEKGVAYVAVVTPTQLEKTRLYEPFITGQKFSFAPMGN